MAKIEIEVLADQVEARLKQLQAAGSNLQPAYTAIGKTLVDRIRLGFRGTRSPWGETWAPLKSRAGKALRDTGRLQRSIVPKVDSQGVTVGTNIKVPGGSANLAAVHQFGTTIVPKTAKWLVFEINGKVIRAKKVTIPARPFMPLRPAGNLDLPPAWASAILRNLAAHLGVEAQGVPA